jgi:hypothetical protein
MLVMQKLRAESLPTFAGRHSGKLARSDMFPSGRAPMI